MSNQGSGLHFLLNGMLTKQEETETNTVMLTFGGQPARSESSRAASGRRQGGPRGEHSAARPHQGWAPGPSKHFPEAELQSQPNREGTVGQMGLFIRCCLRFRKCGVSTAVLLSLQHIQKDLGKDYRGFGRNSNNADRLQRSHSEPGVHTCSFFRNGLATLHGLFHRP